MKDFFGFPWLPMEASENAHIVDEMIVYVHYLMLSLFIGWAIYFIYVLWRFRAKKQTRANYAGLKGLASKYVEAGVILAEVVLLFGFSIPIWKEFTTQYPAPTEALEVGVVAEQFAWNFHYPGPDGKFGRRDPKMVDVQTNILGLDRVSDEAAKDDIVTNVLHLANGRPVIAHVTSKDVIHSLAIPTMRVKQDAVPGMTIPVNFKPIRAGKYLIACSQLCGNGHARMRGFIEVHPQEEFDAWMTVAQASQAESTAASTGDEW
jgi:cytochrome c oxidase subunit 2